jgi:uncharacterized protein YfkK (UPF0435 family)
VARIELTKKKLSKTIKRILKEINSPFERIAFADQRKEFSPGTEPNTPIEEKTLQDLYDFVENNEDISFESADAIRSILGNGFHKDIIYYSQNPTHYRGMYLSTKEINRYFKIDPDDLPEIGKKVFKISFDFKPQKPSGLSSWTSDYEVAEEIAMGLATDNAWVVVLVANSELNPNTFLDLKDIYRVIDSYSNELQKECIALGYVKVSEIHISKPDDNYW